MSKRSSLRHLTLLALLVSPTFLAARCDNALSIGGEADGNEDGDAGAPADVAVEVCSIADCGTPPKSATYQCSDGSPAGPECARDATGKCGWTVRSCPAEALPYACADGSLVQHTAICNGKKECPDGSDEIDCGGPSGGEVFACATPSPDGTKIVFPKEVYCNGKKDCPDGSDEVGCGGSSGGEVFACATPSPDGTKIVFPKEVYCNGKKDCPDGSDETNCTHLGPRAFLCADGSGIALPRSMLCDGSEECFDGSDEVTCRRLEDGVVACADGSKVLPGDHAICDSNKDCADGSDEASCGWSSTVFLCADGSNTVVAKELVCNGKEDCPDGSDEASCDAPISSAHFCTDGTNILLPRVLVCNGKTDCPGGSDEVNCTEDGQSCPSGIESAGAYDAEKECLLPAVPIGCYELISPELTVPTDRTSHCARRRSDGMIFWVGSPKHIAEWEDCSAEEAAAVDAALSCEE